MTTNPSAALPASLQNNPLLNFGRGIAAYAEVKPEHIAPAIQFLLKHAQTAVDLAVNPNTSPTWDQLAEPLEDATESLGRSWSVISHLNSVADSPELRIAYGEMLPEVTAFFSSLGQNLALYQKFKALRNSPEFNLLNRAQKKVIENSLRDFRLGGAELSEADKPRFAQIQDEQAQLGKAFSDHVLDATDRFVHLITKTEELAGLPEDVVAAAADTASQKNLKGWAFTLHFPSYYPVLQYSENRELRRLMYEAYVTRASELAPKYADGNIDWDNTQNMLNQLRLRDEEARMLGFANYAALSLAPKMASTVDEVDLFLTNFAEKSKPFAQRDWDELNAFAKTELGVTDGLQAWDVPFASERLKQARYAFSENELKQYFPLPKVLDGLFGVIQTLFGVKIEPANLPTWHADVQSFSVSDVKGKILAYFYLDPYARSGKRGGAWMDDARGRRELPNGEVQVPVAYLVCNFAPPVKVDGVLRQPTITHDDVITLFHESGHGLHHLLTQVGALGVSGINGVEWDAVELPSQFMENFCWEWEVLEKMTAHVDTGKPLPRELFDKILAAKNFQNGLMTLRQIVMSLTDWRLHSCFDAALAQGQAILHLSRKLAVEFNVIPQPDISRWINTFSHIFAGGYAAGYYSYKWAEVLSADAYSAFEEAAKLTGSVLDPVTGGRYRQEILEVGGSRPAAESFKAFRGREPSIDALLRHGGLH
ncbi:M3 family metallopeptidase [Polynucleobacter asymbioticus]|uniref:oligopeptidase A n=1 Tax=Polynucleobacter asymbioticus (strain DSM 18221 / CIP 109841 / QLW-P1DMWA-1) TaxID=312153 RepID=A4SWT4_POLAQ|nr:M3 family metallopeptidase [Polynucleobacter asymbioticus]ABP33948.1 oligopeptidase A, Metallo peptidase, MEROPS family M03A [Polynucleobacter asymbioticus QLW-P1DMWA-1]APC05812.1 oligopeptidase A [Polynucleobacter asymbioticus]